MPRKLVLDTDTLSNIRTGDIKLQNAITADVDYYVPATQELEFLDGVDDLSDELRESILEVLGELNPERVELDSAPYGVGPYGHGPYGVVTEHYEELMSLMNQIEEHPNNPWDVLGAETAISRDMEFVTRDNTLQQALREYSEEHLLTYDEFKALVEDAMQ